MKKVAGMLADHFYDDKKFPTVSYDSFEYAIEFVLEMAAGILASAVIAVTLDMKCETVVFLTIFWVLRSYAGGLHLDAFWQCFLFSAAVIAGSIAIVKYVSASMWVSHIMYAGGMTAFLFTDPENDRNRRVDAEEDVYFRKKLWQSFLVIAAAYLFCIYAGNRRYAFLIALTINVVYALMIIGKIKNGKRK